ncbi:hypothetical protein DACRYDRAFT_108960 [Dacryopinax primogenitus]|uniref:GH16 domain-containing protein n=1 Tax=Dacryopinax primogenitus (strain DJM 731) TaxID=1858805 RepID=M5G8X3_DACPD|nr:uncharacterized protein DACRYDRAFT_108960 [Dacryopinax primogenitus]EJU00213.1 hypothetical protein DACRYDRAFT_108960 [Dacryopinax primogenitus]
MAKRLRSEQPAVRSPCTGTNFFGCFEFFDDADPTHGDVVFVNDSVAWAQGLVSTTASQAFLGVDNTTSLGDNQGRNSVRLGTKKTYDGALFVLDVAHMPFGCATWLAFWTVSQTQPWPLGGEIDIMEGVNTNTVNQMTLHTRRTTGLKCIRTQHIETYDHIYIRMVACDSNEETYIDMWQKEYPTSCPILVPLCMCTYPRAVGGESGSRRFLLFEQLKPNFLTTTISPIDSNSYKELRAKTITLLEVWDIFAQLIAASRRAWCFTKMLIFPTSSVVAKFTRRVCFTGYALFLVATQ